MMQAITDALTSLLTMVGSIVSGLITSGGALQPLLPLIGLSIAGSVIFLSVKIIKKISWGY